MNPELIPSSCHGCVSLHALPVLVGLPLFQDLSRHVRSLASSEFEFSAYGSSAALNWPNHRGTATAFPLAAFGLSAFFFATISSVAFEDETGHFLLLLAIGTFAICFVGFFFLRVVPYSPSYLAVPTGEHGPPQSNPLTRSKSADCKRRNPRFSEEPGRQPITIHETTSSHDDYAKDPGNFCATSDVLQTGVDETSSLLSTSSSSSSSTPGDFPSQNDDDKATHSHGSHHLDIRGLAMLPRAEFWQLFLLLGLLTGIGLMTIK